MLSALHVENYVLIDSLDISFPEGLVIITGQTGAGKSILLGALSLALGAKADAAIIGSHGENCVVEAVFRVKDDSPVAGILEENDLDPVEDGLLVIRRVVGRSGRSRSFIGDLPVTLPVLQALSTHLVDIHSQHQTLLVRDPAFQLRCLDLYAGNEALLRESRSRWNALSALRRDRAALAEEMKRMAAEREYNEARLSQLEEARLRDGEVEELEQEQRQLANAEAIKENLYAVQARFAPPEGEGPSLDTQLKESERNLQKVSRFIPSAGVLAERISAARIELGDILAEAEDLNAATALNGQRLEQVEQRLSRLWGLMQKFGCNSVAELIERREAYAAALSREENLEEQLHAMDAAILTENEAYQKACAALHGARVAAAPALSEAITDSLRFLELDRALFRVSVLEAAPGEKGADAAVFRFSATGGEAVELARCASGGEMSRIMLSIKAVMASYTAMPTMVFDEIDTGVSGSAADRMGRMICGMGRQMQVLAITHLPQVAAKGEAHYLVEKNDTVTSIRPLDGEGRVREIARLLSGSVVTEEALANARSLLNG